MIADELRARVQSASYHRILDRVEWVQVPFPVYPYLPDEDCLDWHEDRVPEPLIPRVPGREDTLMIDRLPYESTGFFFPGEPGAILAVEARGRTEPEVTRIMTEAFRTAMPHLTTLPPWESPLVDGAIVVHMLGLIGPGLVIQTYIYLIVRMDAQVPRTDPYAPRVLWPVMASLMDETIGEAEMTAGMKLVHALNTSGTLKINGLIDDSRAFLRDPRWWEKLLQERGASIREVRNQWWLDTGHISLTVSTASALLNARNLRRETVTPTQSRPSRRRGEPPPYRYHVLKIDPARARAGSHAGGDSDAHMALHLRRGHWKLYTPSAPLLGKHTGRWWWGAHLAGQADRLVDKDYEVTP